MIIAFFAQLVITLISPLVGILIIYFLLPAYEIRFAVLGLPTNYLEIISLGALAGCFYLLLSRNHWRQIVIQKLNWLKNEPWLLAGLILFLLAMMLATVITVDLRRSAGVLKGWILIPFLVSFAAFLFIQKIKAWEKILIGFIFSITLLSVYGLLDHFFLRDPIVYIKYMPRLDSIFTSANYHAFLAGPAIAFSLSLIFFKSVLQNLWLKIFLITATVINLFAFYLTYSFAGYIALATAFLFLFSGFYIEHRQKISKKTLTVIISISLILFSGALWGAIQSPKFQRDFLEIHEVSALRGRLEIWQTSRHLIQTSPLLGLGLGNFEIGYEQNVEQVLGQKPLEENVIHAHNVFLNFWIEAGILGLLSIIYLLFLVVSLFKKTNLFDPYSSLRWGSAAALIVFTVHGLLDTTFFKNDLAFLFWLPFFILVYLKFYPSLKSNA